MVCEVKDLDHFHAILFRAGDKLVVVDFTATWCPPCKRIAPLYKELAEKAENQNVVFLKVDVDKAVDVKVECKIRCMPTFQFYKNGKMVEEFSGADYDKLVAKVAALQYCDYCTAT